MSKLKIKLKITGLELEIEGSRDEVGIVTTGFGNQLKGFIQPAGINESNTNDNILLAAPEEAGKMKRKKVRRSRAVTNSEVDPSNEALDFKTDPKKYSSPTSDWNTLKKAMWILYVVRNELSLEELPANRITKTFNKHFKQAKTIQLNNVIRDLGKNKLGP
jgi:hypothetical protein